MVQIHSGILLSHKNKQKCAICRDADRPRHCHTEWSKSEREKQISYINSCMWNLEKWYRWSHLQGRNNDCSYQSSAEGYDPLLVSVVTNESTWNQSIPQ